MSQSTVDWQRLLGDLEWLLGEPDPRNPELLRIPVGTITLARELDVPRGTLRRWLEGAEPRHDDGERIIAVWVRITGKAREYVPRTRPVLSATKLRQS